MGGLLLFLSGCAGLEGATVPAEPEGLRWVPEAKARGSGLPTWSLTMPLGARRDGTALVREFQESVQAAGGRYLTGVDLVLAVAQQGPPVECRTRLSLATPDRASAVSSLAAASASAPETRPWRQTDTRQVTELETRCEMVSTTVTVPESYTDHSGGGGPRSGTRMVTQTTWHEECRPEMVEKTVTRFVYQFHAGFIPPDLEQVAYDLSTPPLVESAPECTRVASGGGAGPESAHRLEARVHGCMDVSLPPEVKKPEEDMSRAERLRQEYRLKAIAARTGPACVDRVVRPEQPSQAARPAADGQKLRPCRDSAPPEVKKPEGEMSRAERLRHAYRLKALAAGRQDCDPGTP